MIFVKIRSCHLARAIFHFRGTTMKLPKADNDNHKPVKLLRYCELNETRGIGYSRRHLYTLESERKFPKRITLGPPSPKGRGCGSLGLIGRGHCRCLVEV